MIRDAIATVTRSTLRRGGWRVAPTLNRMLGGGTAVARVPGVGLMRLDLDERQQAELYWTGLDHATRTLIGYITRNIADDAVVLDVGGNFGVVTLAVAATLRRGRVITFEPNPFNGRALTENILLNHLTNVTVVHCGLSDRTERITVHGDDKARNWSLVSEGDATFNVSIAMLDDHIDCHFIRRVDLIKLDIEGHELHALRGATETLRRFRPTIVFECNPYWLRKFGTRGGELVEFVESLGYTVHRIDAPGIAGSQVWHHEADAIKPGDWMDLVAVPVA